MIAVMTDEMLRHVFEKAECAKEGDTWVLPSGRTLTLYAGRDGGSLSAPKLIRVTVEKGLVTGKSQKGELYLFAVEHIFGAQIVGGVDTAKERRAGFV
ncbi:MAG: hypothetical protein AAGA56_25245 [Myxococcota bacterium]